jgi:hypothetical protein
VANPNIEEYVTTELKTIAKSSSGISVRTLVENPASSGKLFKISSLIACNLNSSDNSLSVYIVLPDASTQHIVKGVAIPPDASIVVVGSDRPIYLEENQLLQVPQGLGLNFVGAYEEIS